MSSENVLTGRVKWFNNKSGFGFVTVVLSSQDESLIGKDIFTHHTSIVVGKEQFRYLVQGEYIEFSLNEITDESSEHKYQTSNVKGIGGGFLMCETRYEAKMSEKDVGENKNVPKWNVSRKSKGKKEVSEEEA